MGASCRNCGSEVETSRSSARVLHTTAGRPAFEYLCAGCSGRADTATPAPGPSATCCECDAAVLPSSAQPVFDNGRFRLRCADCASGRSRPKRPTLVEDPNCGVPGRPSGSRSPWLVVTGAIAAGVAAAVVSSTPSVADDNSKPAPEPTTPQVVALELDVASDDEAEMEFADVALAPADAPFAHELSVPADFTVEEWKQGLLDTVVWYHPIAGDERQLPDKGTRRFGAKRPPSRPECGAGHCGVDVGFKRGLIVHAASFGTVDRVIFDPDSRSGRYVKLVHPSGYATWYMHLDKIRHDLQRGMEVGAGEALGTVGRTGIKKSEPHLHFAVSKEHNGREFFIDPEPMLRQAVVLEEPAPFRSRFNN